MYAPVKDMKGKEEGKTSLAQTIPDLCDKNPHLPMFAEEWSRLGSITQFVNIFKWKENVSLTLCLVNVLKSRSEVRK